MEPNLGSRVEYVQHLRLVQVVRLKKAELVRVKSNTRLSEGHF